MPNIGPIGHANTHEINPKEVQEKNNRDNGIGKGKGKEKTIPDVMHFQCFAQLNKL